MDVAVEVLDGGAVGVDDLRVCALVLRDKFEDVVGFDVVVAAREDLDVA